VSLPWIQHLILAPVLLPLLCGAFLLTINETRHSLKFWLNASAMLLQVVIAVSLLILVDGDYWEANIGVYLAANWQAPFGIAFLVDRLSAMMLLLTSLLGSCALLYSMMRWSRIGVHYHSLFQFLMMGLNGAFLTHDLFNLFVFFEVMLAASYGLLLHGYNLARIRAGMQFIAVNLVAALLFLIGLALIYASADTLNMSDLAAHLPYLSESNLDLFRIGAGALAIAFLVKSAMWPLGFWLPTTYSAASPPVAAMLVLMTKVGVYVIFRLWLLLFANDDQSVAGFGNYLLFCGGVITIGFGAFGMLASNTLGQLASYGAIISSGTLLAVLGLSNPALIAPALFYFVSSTLGMAAFVLLIELTERSNDPLAALLAVTRQAFEYEDVPEQPVGVGIPAGMAFLGLSFAACSLIIAGLPPLSGFIAKFSLFHQLLTHPLSVDSLLFMFSVLFAGIMATIALMRFGVRTFWGSGTISARLHLSEALSVIVLIAMGFALTILAGSIFGYMERSSTDLQNPALYIERVLAEPMIPSGGKP
jgi:multicomponent K+:H+ antiporter subunit D